MTNLRRCLKVPLPSRGERELAISPGPTDNPASDWTCRTGLLRGKIP